jgi:NADH oxidase (H2O2-forming)
MIVIVLGNGVAGNTASSTLRHLDNQADIVIISEEAFPEYTACALPHYIAGEFDREQLFLRTEKSYSDERIKTILGQKVTAINPGNKLISLDSQSLSYDKLIIATGSTPVKPPIPGIELDGVFTLKSPGDADRILGNLGKSTVVIGSGPVGVETAIALRKRGAEVHLVEFLDRIMPKIFDEKPASILTEILEKHEIKVFTGERVVSISGNGRVESATTDKRVIECDEIVLSVGMRPNVELAKQAGINIGPLGGIAVNRQMKTNLEGIYACGDCVETKDMASGKDNLSPLWHNAKRQGIIAAYNCAGIHKIYPGSETITSLDVYGTHAVSFGDIETDNKDGDIEVIEKDTGSNYHRLVISKRRLVGAQSVGDAKDLGALLYAMVKRENLNKIQYSVDEELQPINPLYHRIARYLTA